MWIVSHGGGGESVEEGVADAREVDHYRGQGILGLSLSSEPRPDGFGKTDSGFDLYRSVHNNPSNLYRASCIGSDKNQSNPKQTHSE